MTATNENPSRQYTVRELAALLTAYPDQDAKVVFVYSEGPEGDIHPIRTLEVAEHGTSWFDEESGDCFVIEGTEEV
jgi:hypothetical protein